MATIPFHRIEVAMPVPTEFRLIGGPAGPWRITHMSAVCSEGLPSAERLAVLDGASLVGESAEIAWTLRGVTSNERHVTKVKHDSLVAR